MNNTTRNASGPLGEWTAPQDSTLSLAILLVVMAIKLLLIAAVIAERSTNCTVRLILGNLLLSSVISSIPVVFFDIFGILGGLGYLGRFNTRVWFMIGILIFYGGSTAQVLFATMYSVAIFLQIRFWNRPVLKPRSTKYFILATVCVYIVAFISATPLLYLYFETTPTAFCNCFLYSFIIMLLHSLFLFVLPAIFSLTILLMTVRYYKHNSLHQDIVKHNDKGLQGLLHFGFFLFAEQVIHFATHVLLPIMWMNLLNRFFDDTFFSVRSVSDGIHLTLIPTPILILIFFKPAREILTRWLTCRFRCQKSSTDTVTVPV